MKKAGLLFLLIFLGHAIFAQASQKSDSKAPATVSGVKATRNNGSAMSSRKASPTESNTSEITYRSSTGIPSNKKASSTQANDNTKPGSKGPATSRKAAEQ